MGGSATLHETATATWQQRFRVEKVVWAQIAAARPERGLAASNRPGRFELHAWDVTTGELRRLTDRPAGTVLGLIAPDGRHVYYLDDRAGNEVGHPVRVPWEGGPPEDVTPGLPPYSTSGGDMSRSANLLAFTMADASGYALVAIDLDPSGTLGEPRVLCRGTRFFTAPVLSPRGELAVVASTERTGMQHYSLLAYDTRSGEQVAELWDGPETSLRFGPFAPPAGGADTLRLAATTNRSGFTRPLIWQPLTGERRDLRVEELEGDVEPLDWSADGTRLLLMQTSRATERLWIYDLAADAPSALDHPAGSFGSCGEWSDEIAVQWQDATHPPQVIALDAATGKQTRTLLPAGPAPRSRPLRSVTFTSADGQEIQGWLGVPDGEGPFATILHTHGGPEAVAMNTFGPTAQAWLDHGFAFLTINYRGSVTFGREFQQQIWGDLGRWELADMVAARDWLVREGVADPTRIFPSGGSYGGYLTLLALGRRPDLWAGGLAAVAIADWKMLYEDSADIFGGYCVALFGGTPAELPERYTASSPSADVEAVRAPLLIIQERHDARTPARQVEVYADRLRQLGKPVELHWFETGHLGSFANAEQGIAYQELMLAFARRVLDRQPVAVDR
jgi:dipeptidyl aminopeptidase/acylaminoacyl peptidase